MLFVRPLVLTAALLSSVYAARANAEVINLTYIGTVTNNALAAGITSISGSGVITIADGLSNAATADVTHFSFTLSVNGSSGADPITYNLGDLTNGGFFPPPGFSATLDPLTGAVITLDLATDFGSRAQIYFDQSLVFSTGGDSITSNFDVGAISTGSFTATQEPVPEPTSLALLGAGLSFLGFNRRKRDCSGAVKSNPAAA